MIRSLPVLVLLGLVVSCGYRSDSLLPAGADSIAIVVFENETFYREIEFDLTRDLSEEIRRRTHYRLLNRERADLVLTGRIRSVRRPTLVETDDDRVSEQGVILSAEVVVTDRRSGREVDRFLASRRAEFVVERGESLETAFTEVSEELAERIVDLLEAGSFRTALQELRQAP